ncbi:hypothetical protein H7J73_04870 [Mycolicibacterium komossense]|uniref:Uncharacterized protein n=1 Tax=Mycolicibacterium komossense TaxID=1779 RepID=A0ABT3C7D6_9MYCO|nr:hypothetical protein [Mycolicibacterium komossense]
MAVPPDLLERIAGLSEAREGVRQAVERVMAAQQPDSDPITKIEALSLLDGATERWLEQSQQVETELLELARNDEPEPDANISTATDSVERLWGISLIHLAVSADLAKISSIDSLENEDDPVSVAGPPPAVQQPSAIAAIVDDGPAGAQIGGALATPAHEADEADDLAVDAPELTPPAEEVLRELVHRASECTCKVLVGTLPIPSAHVIFDNVTPLLKAALGATPDAISTAAEKIARTVTRLAILVLGRVRAVVDAVIPGTFDFVKEQLIEASQDHGAEHILTPVVRPVVARLLDEQGCAVVISQKRWDRRKGAPEPDNKAAFRKILKHNKRWVSRPVPFAASTVLRPLWHLSWSGVPAAPIAACLLLAWTIFLTGDELDIEGWPFPNFYRPGLLTLA